MKKNSRRTLYVVILAGLLGGCQRHFVVGNPHRVITISISPDNPSHCEVDYPVAFLRIDNHQHTVKWASNDNTYYILFNGSLNPVANNPATNPVILVPAGGVTTDYHPTISAGQANYFQYGIYTSDPKQNPNAQACKTWDDDHDTGLNVKQ